MSNSNEQAATTQARRGRFGALCPRCGSVSVVVTHTRNRALPSTARERVFERRRRMVCIKCGRSWWRTHEVIERVVGELVPPAE